MDIYCEKILVRNNLITITYIIIMCHKHWWVIMICHLTWPPISDQSWKTIVISGIRRAWKASIIWTLRIMEYNCDLWDQESLSWNTTVISGFRRAYHGIQLWSLGPGEFVKHLSFGGHWRSWNTVVISRIRRAWKSSIIWTLKVERRRNRQYSRQSMFIWCMVTYSWWVILLLLLFKSERKYGIGQLHQT